MIDRANTGSTLGDLARAKAAFQQRTIAAVVLANPEKDHTERDLRNIRACASIEELEAYEASAKRRGIEPHEVRAIAECKISLTRKRRK